MYNGYNGSEAITPVAPLPLYYTPLVTALAQIPKLTRNAVDQAARLGKSLIYSLSIRSCSAVKVTNYILESIRSNLAYMYCVLDCETV